MQTISENKPVTLKEQKKTLTLALACVKFAPKSQEILKYVPALKLSIMQAEEQKRRESFERSLPDKRQQDLFPNDLPDFNAYHKRRQLDLFPYEEQEIDYNSIALWIRRNLE